MNKSLCKLFFLLGLLLLAGCETNMSIVNNVDEREANEIIVFLASKGIAAQKIAAPTSMAAGAAPSDMYSIMVSSEQSTDAMSILNRHGLPRRMGSTLLSLFPGGGLMTTDREQTIRYQAGLAEELRNTVLKIDGIVDANVQISFPPVETSPLPGATPPKTTAAVYIKHRGIMEDPNSHMEVKIKRLMSASVNGLAYEDVSVISDRARFADVTLLPEGETISAKTLQQTYVSIWGLVLTKSSLARFRFIFFLFVTLILAFAGALGWMVYKFYPQLRLKKEEPSAGLPPAEPEVKP